jgi:hypothetical protein
VRALAIALASLLAAATAQAQQSAESPEAPAEEQATPNVAPSEAARVTADEWPSSPLAPTSALNPRVERSQDVGLMVTGGVLVLLAYIPKAIGASFMEQHTCADENIGLTMLPFIGGLVGLTHGWTCEGTDPGDTYVHSLWSYNSPFPPIFDGGAAALELIGAILLVVGLVGGEGVVTDSPEAGLSLRIGAGNVALSGSF